jgi:uncharacterized membrane protein HdeD (DUF308 family)
MQTFLKKIKANVVISSLLCAALGVVLLVYPGDSMRLVGIAVGVVLILTGIVKVFDFLINRDGTLYLQLNLIFGIVLAVVGVWIITQPEKVMSIIPIIIGIIITIHGISKLRQAIELCQDHYEKWWVALLLGILTAGLGILLIFRPFEALETVVQVIGAFLIYDGFSNLWIASRVYKTTKQAKQEAEALDVEAKEL